MINENLLMRASTRFALLEKWVAFLVTFLVLIISNRMTWLCVLEIDMPLFGCWYGSRTNELFLYVIALVLALLSLILNNEVKYKFSVFWQKNSWLLLFLFFCLLSVVWSIDWIRTVYKSILVIFSMLVAVYLGVRYRASDWLNIITIFSLITITLSFLLVMFLPEAAVMQTPWHFGSWRGAFSHRNYLGSIIAYSNACLLISVFLRKKLGGRVLYAVFYILSWILLFFSRSATGVILGVMLNFVVLLYFAYLKWGHLMQRKQYLAGAGGLTIFALILVLNLDRVLGLLGRTSSLTGRVPLWTYLYDKVSEHNLWLGYGLGAIWDHRQFRVAAARALGWSFEVINSHNGFVDVFVALGVIGLFLFLLLNVYIVFHVFSYLKKEHTSESAWLLVTLVYVIVSNITISFFFDFETFHWVLFVVILAVCTFPNQQFGYVDKAVG